MAVVALERPAKHGRTDASVDERAAVEQLWRRYRTDGEEVVRTRLVVHYMKSHVRRLAERLHSSLPQQVDVDDLIQQGYLGLAEAIERFDLDRNVSFETFSSRRIVGAMRDYLRAIDPMPRLARTRIKRLEAEQERHHKEHGRPASDQELQRQLRLTVRKYEQLCRSGRGATTVSYNAVDPQVDPGDDADGLEGLPDPSRPSPLSDVEKDDLRRWLTRGFSRRDHLIIILYYYEHLTMKEVGRALGISESRVSQRLESIIGCLRARLSYRGAMRELMP